MNLELLNKLSTLMRDKDNIDRLISEWKSLYNDNQVHKEPDFLSIINNELKYLNDLMISHPTQSPLEILFVRYLKGMENEFKLHNMIDGLEKYDEKCHNVDKFLIDDLKFSLYVIMYTQESIKSTIKDQPGIDKLLEENYMNHEFKLKRG